MSLNISLGKGRNSGIVLKTIEDAIENIIDKFENIDIQLIKDSINIDKSQGSDLEILGSYFNVYRQFNESDKTLRSKIKTIIKSRVPVTKDAIQDLFELLTGLRPIITEDFVTRVYAPGQSKDNTEAIGQFSISFNVYLSQVFETIRIGNDGLTLKLSHETNVNGIGSFAAYLSSDFAHTTNLATSIDDVNSTITVSSIPYEPNTLFDVEYEIILLDDYNTIQEVYDNFDFFSLILQLVKAAGIKTSDFDIRLFLKSFFQHGGLEQLSINDYPIMFNVEPKPNETIEQIAIAGWDVSRWDTGYWDAENLGVVFDDFEYTLI